MEHNIELIHWKILGWFYFSHHIVWFLQFYTDPITKNVFRSLKSAEQYFISGKPVGAHVPIMSVTDMYYFDRCTDMVIISHYICNWILAMYIFGVLDILWVLKFYLCVDMHSNNILLPTTASMLSKKIENGRGRRPKMRGGRGPDFTP